jgi:hypothetical protein
MTEMARSLGGVLTIDGDQGTRLSTSFLLARSNRVADDAGRNIHARRRGSPIRETGPAWRAASSNQLAD